MRALQDTRQEKKNLQHGPSPSSPHARKVSARARSQQPQQQPPSLTTCGRTVNPPDILEMFWLVAVRPFFIGLSANIDQSRKRKRSELLAASHLISPRLPPVMSAASVPTMSNMDVDPRVNEKETDEDMQGVPLVSIDDENAKEEAATQLVADDDEIVVAAPVRVPDGPAGPRKMVVKAPRKQLMPRDGKEGEGGSESEGESEGESEEESESEAVEAEVVQDGEGEDEEDVDVSGDDGEENKTSARTALAPSPRHIGSEAAPSSSSSSMFSFPSLGAGSSASPSASPSAAALTSLPLPSTPMDMLLHTMQQNSMILMKQQQQQESLMLFMQQQAMLTQTNFEMLAHKVDSVNTRMLQQEREMNDLKRGVSFRADDMEQGLDILSRKPQLRRVFEFIARYGMDTRTGYVVAFPVLIAGKLCVAVSLQLLSYAMAAMFPINMKPQKDFTLAGLKLLMNSVSTETVNHRTVLNFTSLFGVDSYSGTAQRQASNNMSVWRVFQATTFLKAIRLSLTHAGDTGLGILEPEVDADAIQWTRTARIMWSQASMLDKNAARRMAWAQTVQEEVLRDPAVKQFFQLVPTVMGAAASASPSSASGSSSRPPSPLPLPAYDDPFHFCGVEPMLDFPVKNHAQLVKERRLAIQRAREAEEERQRDDRIESQSVNGRSLRKRKAPASGKRAPVGKTTAARTSGTAPAPPAARASGAKKRSHASDSDSSSSGRGQKVKRARAARDGSSEDSDSDSSSSSGSSSETDEEVVRASAAAARRVALPVGAIAAARALKK